MTEYSNAIALAKRLITKKGRSGVSVYRPASGTTTFDGDTETDFVGQSYSLQEERPWKLDVSAPDVLIASGLHVVFLDLRQARGAQGQFGFEVSFRSWQLMPDSIMPDATAVAYFIPSELAGTRLEAGDLVVSGLRRYSIMRCDPLEPGDELIMFAAQLKE